MHKLIKPFSISLISQMISSATNLGISMYLVRNMEKSQFGLYGLAFGTMLIFSGVSSSLISDQLVVNLPDQQPQLRANYQVNHIVIVILLCFIFVSLGIFMKFFFRNITINKLDISDICFPIALAVGCYSFRDILIRIAYLEQKEFIVLISSIFVALGVVIGFVVIKILNLVLFAKYAVFAYATGQFTGSMGALYFLKLPLRGGISQKILKDALKDCWRGGKWNVLVNFTYHLRIQLHNFIIGPMLGLSKLAEVNAARVLITPAIIAIPPLTQILLPRLAFLRVKGIASFKRGIFLSIISLTSIVLLYISFLFLILPWIRPLVLGEKYQNINVYVILWSAVAFLLAIRNSLNIACQAMRIFYKLFCANIIALVAAISTVFVLIKNFEANGVIFSLCIAELSLCITLFSLIRHEMKDFNK